MAITLDLVKVCLFYKPFSDVATAATLGHIHCYNQNDQSGVTSLRAAGASAKKFLIYTKPNSVTDPYEDSGLYANGQARLAINTPAHGDTFANGQVYRNNNPGWNNVAENTAEIGVAKPDVCLLRDRYFSNNDYFMRLAAAPNTGLVARSGGAYLGNSYLQYWTDHVRDFLELRGNAYIWQDTATKGTVRWDGIFLDDLDTRIDGLTTSPLYLYINGVPVWGNSDTAVDTIRDILDWHYEWTHSHDANLGGEGLCYANIQGYTRSAADMAIWKTLVVKDTGHKRIDGVMCEHSCGLDYAGTIKDEANLLEDLDAFQWAAAHGLDAWMIGQDPTPADASAKTKYAMCVYLLVVGPRTHVRIQKSYGTLTDLRFYSDTEALRSSNQSWFEESQGVLRRNFWGGYVRVNTNTKTGEIVYTGGIGVIPPFPQQQVDRQFAVNQNIEIDIAWESAYGGTMSYSATGLTGSGASLNTSTSKISGTLTTPGTYNITVTGSESGGTTADVSFTMTVTGSSTGTGGTVKRINCGGAAVSAVSGDTAATDWEADTIASPNAVYTGDDTTNATSVGTTFTRAASVPSYFPDDVFKTWRWDNSNPGPQYTFTGLDNALTYTVVIGFVNTGDADNARTLQAYVNGSTSGSAFDFYDETSGTANTAFAKTFAAITPSSNQIVVRLDKTGTSATRICAIACISDAPAAGTPTLSAISTQTVTANEVVSIATSATAGAVGATLSYALTNAPAGWSIDATTGVISGTTEYNSGTWALKYTATVTVTETPGGNTDAENFTVWFKPGTVVERINCGGTLQASVDTDSNKQDWEKDSDNSTNAHPTRTTSNTSSQSNTGATATLHSSAPPWYNIQNVIQYYIFDNATPYIKYVLPATGENIITLGFNSSTDADNARNVAIKINGSTAETIDGYDIVSGTNNVFFVRSYIASPSAGNITVEVDKASTSAARLFSIEQFQALAPPQPPVLAAIGNQSVDEGGALTLNLSVTDPNPGTVFTWEYTGPDHGVLTDNEDGTADLVFTPGYTDGGVAKVNVTVYDDTGLFDGETFNLTINLKEGPVLVPVGNLTGEEEVVSVITIHAGVGYGGTGIPSLDIAGLPAWASFVDNADGTGTLTLEPVTGDAGTYLRIVVTATLNGQTDQEAIKIVVSPAYPDTLDPTMVRLVTTVGRSLRIGICGEALSAGRALYYSSSDGRYYRTEADATGKDVIAGVAANSGATGQPIVIQTRGDLEAGFATDAGQVYVIGNTPGIIIPAASQSSSTKLSVVGYGLGSGKIRLDLNATRIVKA